MSSRRSAGPRSCSGRPPSPGCCCLLPLPLSLPPLLVMLLPLLFAAPTVFAQQSQQQQRKGFADPRPDGGLHPTASPGPGPAQHPGVPMYSASYLNALSSAGAGGSRWPALEEPPLPPPCSEGPPRGGRARLQPYPLPSGPGSPLGLGPPVGPVLPPPRTALAIAPYPYASPRSDDFQETDMSEVGGTRRGYYGHEVGYGSYFPIGLDPLTILAGLAFLAFIIQTLYLLLYKHYGLGLGGLGAGATVGIGPLSADRHQRDEQQAWANTIASRIDSTASVYERHNNGTADPADPVDPAPAAAVTAQDQDPQDGAQQQAQQAAPAPTDDVDADARQRRQMGLGPLAGLSLAPFDTLLALLRRSWNAPARSCGPSWLCKLVYFARMLTERMRTPAAGRASTTGHSPPPATLK